MRNRGGTLAALLHTQGFGARRECVRLVRKGVVEIGTEAGTGIHWRRAEDPEESPPTHGLHLKVGSTSLPYRETLYLAFHKPPDCECSRNPGHHRSIFSYFPEPLLRRGLQAAGRLDADTTGLLIMSDSGDFIHFLTSPRRHVSKTYRVQARHPISPEQADKLRRGIVLRDEEEATLPAWVELEGERTCLLTVGEGRYHQVKRMLAAVGNRVEGIHRMGVGALRLEPGLEPGQWRYLGEIDLLALGYNPSHP